MFHIELFANIGFQTYLVIFYNIFSTHLVFTMLQLIFVVLALRRKNGYRNHTKWHDERNRIVMQSITSTAKDIRQIV